jgi:hypothetical protein
MTQCLTAPQRGRRPMRNAMAALFALLVTTGCVATMVPPPFTGEPTPLRPPVDAWARVLKTHVDPQGRVDFAGLSGNRADLDRYVSWIYDNGPANRPDMFRTREQLLAYHLNAYNALALYNVLDSGIPETHAGYAGLRFFRQRELVVGGQLLSLRAYQDDVIRKLGEPRVHFALNCMSAGCPRLPREPFAADKLEQQLERATREFFAEVRNVRVVAAERTVYLSKILDFHREDFLAAAPSLLAYVNRYRAQPVPEDYEVEFTPFDWTINRQPLR